MPIIETRGLTHSFSGLHPVLNDVSLQVPEGSIYGFLGPNGSGKTTTIKVLLGLLKSQKGEVLIFGKHFKENRIEILRRTGAFIETPSLYGQLTARENLKVLQKIYDVPSGRIDDTLQLVGLSDTGKKRAGTFSLGMKQRLAIGMALLHNPELLILDEPTNGLDPAGIIEVRDLLRKLNTERSVTILISSHLLSEIEKVVTHIGIIKAGNLCYQGPFSELIDKCSNGFSSFIETSDNRRAIKIITTFASSAVIERNRIIIPGDREFIARINRELVNLGIDVYAIGTRMSTLENIFMELTDHPL